MTVTTASTKPAGGPQLARLGVIGCGVIGRVHIAAAARTGLAEVVAVADISAAALQAAVADFGIARAYDDPYALLADDGVEAVVIALPAVARHEVVLAAFAAGKHVLVEKPPAATSRDLRELIAARGQLTAGSCSPRFRTPASARAAAELIADGVLGDLRAIYVRGHRQAPARSAELPPAWRLSRSLNGGGVLWNWGPYDLDFVLGLTGWSLTPELAFGQTWPVSPELADWVPAGSDAEAHATALIRFTGGCTLNIDRGEYLPARDSAICQFIGSHGSLSVDMIAGSEPAGMIAGSEPAVTVEQLTDAGLCVTQTVDRSADNTFDGRADYLIGDFASAVISGTQPLTTLENSLTILTTIEAIRTSAETGTAVRIQASELDTAPAH
jgi:predicted dehydrogenase